MRLNLPTLLTLSRILVLPILVIIYLLPFDWMHPIAALLFAFACITDWFDGYLARTRGQLTRFGAFLDPVADKLLVTTALVLILSEHSLHFIVVPVAIIVGREIAISALREWMAEIGKRVSVAVSLLGKIKTGLQMVALGILLWVSPPTPLWFVVVGELCLYAAAALTLWSMLIYLKAAWPDLTSSQESQ